MDNILSPAFWTTASHYIRAGLSPIPLKTGDEAKAPAICDWTDFQQRQPETEELLKWTKAFPDAGLGLVLGTAIGHDDLCLVAIDIDQDEFVEPVKQQLFDGGNTDQTFVAKFGVKGLTIFALASAGCDGRKFRNTAGMAVELLAAGQQTVMPPSFHPDGGIYKWTTDDVLPYADLKLLPQIPDDFEVWLQALVSDVPADDEGDTIKYLGDGHFENVSMVYPSNVNEVQCRMAASAARQDYFYDRVNDDSRDVAVTGMVEVARSAYVESGSSEPWDDGVQAIQAASQYDRAMVKGMTEWVWKQRDEDRHQPVTPDYKPLKLIHPTLWHDAPIPPRLWLVQDWIPSGSVTSLYGDGGVGKTYLAQQLLTACAVGKNWLGKKTTPGNAIGLFCEDDDRELHRRQEAINQLYDVEFTDLGNLALVSRPGDDNILMTFSKSGKAETTPLWGELVTAAQDLDADLIVIDTAADTFGGNENVRTEVRQYITNGLGSLARDAKASVVLCAHPSRAGLQGSGDGGSTAWNNSVRSRLSMTRVSSNDNDEIEDRRILTKMKANYSSINDEAIDLMWDDGTFRSVAALSEEEQAERQASSNEGFLALFDQLVGDGKTLSDSPQSGNYAPKLMLELAECNLPKHQLAEAMKGLIREKALKVEMVGSTSKEKRSLIRV